MSSGVIYLLFSGLPKEYVFFFFFSLFKEMGNLHFSGVRQTPITK